MSRNAEWYSYRGVSRSENCSWSWWAEIWARESMFMSRDELARAAGTSQARIRIEAFETNNAMPTLRQLGLLGITR